MRRPVSQLPETHRGMRGRFLGVAEDGTQFELDVAPTRRMASGSEIVRAQVRAMGRGMPLTQGDLYKEGVEIALFVARRRHEVRVGANGMYSVDHRHHDRTLRGAVAKAVAALATRPRPAPEAVAEAGNPAPAP